MLQFIAAGGGAFAYIPGIMTNMAKGFSCLFNLLNYLERSADRFPDKIAFADEKESLTFAQLRDLGLRVGAAVVKSVEDINLPVAVLTTHSVCDIAAFVGALYAGCFYIPLDGGAPREFTELRLETIKPAMTIEARSVSDLPCETPDMDIMKAIRSRILSTDPAYAIFTSGSTGAPKAALVSHGSVVNLAEWFYETFGFSERVVFAAQAPFYFDASVKEIYSTLRNGCTMHLLPKKLFISPLKVLRFVEEKGANVLPWAAAAVKMIANSGVFEQYIPGGVEDVIFGGENMPSSALNIWKRAMPDARFTNVYGPSETTVDSAYYTLDRELPDGVSVPIGRACRNTGLLILDSGGKPVPAGEPGELYIQGAGVGLGYYGDPARTTEAFMQNPLNPHYRDIVYRTGDIVKQNEYGELVFLARADDQVKHMGSRIELGEVESAAAGVDGIRLVCCIYDKEKLKIVMFYEGGVSEHDVSVSLNACLPRYMCPNLVIKLDEMPVTPNGKIDRVKVKERYHENT